MLEYTEDDLVKKLKRISFEEMHRIVCALPKNTDRVDLVKIEVGVVYYNVLQSEMDAFASNDWTVEEYLIEARKRDY